MAGGIRGVADQARHGASTVRGLANQAVGGPGQARVVLVLAGVLGLNGADAATISATANNLEKAFQIGNTAIGLLVSVVAVAGAVCTLPFGVLADRTRRTRLLAAAVVAWSAATVFSGAATSPPLDAARLDVMHPRLWGRAEAIRTVLRTLGEAAAPTLFGYVSQYVFGTHVAASTAGGGAGAGGGGGHATGLQYTFLLFLLALVAAGLLALIALRTYPRDVATARASVEATRSAGSDPGDGHG